MRTQYDNSDFEQLWQQNCDMNFEKNKRKTRNEKDKTEEKKYLQKAGVPVDAGDVSGADAKSTRSEKTILADALELAPAQRDPQERKSYVYTH